MTRFERHLLGGDQPSGIDALRESCKNGDNCKVEASDSVESSKYAGNCKSGHSRTCPESGAGVSDSAPSVSIVDELRRWASTEVPYKYGHQLHAIADRIEEQFSRVCEQQEAVLLKKMDQQRAMLTEQRDAARAKVIALCNECDKLKRAADRDADHIESLSGAYNDMERERDELQAKLDELESFDPETSTAAFGDDNGKLRRMLSRAAMLLANAEQDRDANYAYWMDCKEKVVHANMTIEELQAKLDEIAGVLDGRD